MGEAHPSATLAVFAAFLLTLGACAANGGEPENASAAGEQHRADGHHGSDDPRPFDAEANAMADVDAALLAAQGSGKRVLLVLGGNWCHDSRGLARKFEDPVLGEIINTSYELVYVDVGRRDRNLEVAQRFGVAELIGTPTVLILSPEGALLNGDTVHDWRTAHSKSLEETTAYFRAFALADGKPQ